MLGSEVDPGIVFLLIVHFPVKHFGDEGVERLKEVDIEGVFLFGDVGIGIFDEVIVEVELIGEFGFVVWVKQPLLTDLVDVEHACLRSLLGLLLLLLLSSCDLPRIVLGHQQWFKYSYINNIPSHIKTTVFLLYLSATTFSYMHK